MKLNSQSHNRVRLQDIRDRISMIQHVVHDSLDDVSWTPYSWAFSKGLVDISFRERKHVRIGSLCTRTMIFESYGKLQTATL